MKKSIARLLKALEKELAELDDDDRRCSPRLAGLAREGGSARLRARRRPDHRPHPDRRAARARHPRPPPDRRARRLAPWTRQSGQWRGKSFIGGGRRACAAPCSWAPWSPHVTTRPQAFRDKLVAAGKPKLVALIAVARKLLTILNAILRDRTPWQPNRLTSKTVALPATGRGSARSPKRTASRSRPAARNRRAACRPSWETPRG